MGLFQPMISNSITLTLFLLILSSSCSSTTICPFYDCLLHFSVPRNLIFNPRSTIYTTLFASAFNQRAILNNPFCKPLIIITPTHESHVQSIVLCSKLSNLEIRTRSGGHDFEGLSYSSALGPFIVLDLRYFNSISINEDNTAWVQSGATLGELYFSIASKSQILAFSAGSCPAVGVGGLFSGGGIGTISRSHGIAADHVLDIRIVNADGEVLDRESMGEDLFWALRGGGGASFGVILSYKIDLVQVPPTVTIFFKSLNISEGAIKAADQWQHIAYRMDNRLFISATFTTNKTLHADFSGLFLGEMDELLHIMKNFLPDIRISSSNCNEMSWIESVIAFSFHTSNIKKWPLSVLLERDTIAPKFFFKVKTDIVTEPITEQSWEEIWKYVSERDEQPVLLIEPLGGKIAEIGETETPFPHRNGSKFIVQYFIFWTETGESAATKHIDALRGLYNFMTPFVSKKPRAAYLNYRDLDFGRNMVGMVSYDKAKDWGERYYKSNFERLAYVKLLTDPHNFFKNEQSIPPLID